MVNYPSFKVILCKFIICYDFFIYFIHFDKKNNNQQWSKKILLNRKNYNLSL